MTAPDVRQDRTGPSGSVRVIDVRSMMHPQIPGPAAPALLSLMARYGIDHEVINAEVALLRAAGRIAEAEGLLAGFKQLTVGARLAVQHLTGSATSALPQSEVRSTASREEWTQEEFTTKEAADMLRISDRQVRNRLDAGTLRGRWVGGRRMVAAESLRDSAPQRSGSAA